jgi:hypothetical protein
MPLQNMSLIIDNIFLSHNLMEHYVYSFLQKQEKCLIQNQEKLPKKLPTIYCKNFIYI